MIKLPEKFEESMKSLLKEDYQKYVKSMEKPAKRGLRVNSEYVQPEEFCKLFSYQIKPILNESNLFCLESDEKIGNSVFHHAGMIYLQEPSSMLAVLALDVKDGENILDLCAAPGGKTGQILEKDRTGIVVSNEIVRARANVLLSNIERQGFKNSTITSLAPETLSGLLPDFFDKILVDAPCSGEGMFRKESETISEWNAGLPEFNHTRQLQILKEADKMLKQGGTLVYSTCTFNRKEDEETVAIFAKEYGYERPELHDYAKYGYTEDKKQGLRKWYTDYINKEISYNGTKIGLPEEILRCKPCHESNFKYATQVAAFKEPSNIIEIIQSIFSKITRLFEYRSNKIETE